MKKLLVLVAIAALGCAPHTAYTPTASPHVTVMSNQVNWGDAPPFLPKGGRFAVLSGDPSKPGIFVARLEMPPGYRVAPHWHPTDEHVTVISGRITLTMGDTFNASAGTTYSAGDYVLLPARMSHSASSQSGVVVQIHGMGPFALNYVNPADDPSRAPAQ